MDDTAAISRRWIVKLAGLAPVLPMWSRRLLAMDTREPMPRFTAKTMDGETFSNESIKGKVVLVQFWATWCRYCRSDEPHVDTIVEEFGPQGLVVLAVDAGEDRKKVKSYLADHPRRAKIVLMPDTNLAALFAARSYPYYVLVDRDGKIAATQNGAGGEAALRHLLRKASF